MTNERCVVRVRLTATSESFSERCERSEGAFSDAVFSDATVDSGSGKAFCSAGADDGKVCAGCAAATAAGAPDGGCPAFALRLPLMRDLKNLLDAPMLLQLREGFTGLAVRHEPGALELAWCSGLWGGRWWLAGGDGGLTARERQPPRMYSLLSAFKTGKKFADYYPGTTPRGN